MIHTRRCFVNMFLVQRIDICVPDVVTCYMN